MLKLLEVYRTIRKTEGSPCKVSVYDMLEALSGYPLHSGHVPWQRLRQRYPDLEALVSRYRFHGKGQQPTPVVDESKIAVLAALVPGNVAAQRRREMMAAEPQAVQNEMLDAESLLRERGYSSQECSRLAAELAKDIKLIAASEGCQLRTIERYFGPVVKQVTVLSRQHDARLIQDVMASFQQRPLHHRVVGGNPVTKQRWELLHTKGRGRGHQRPTRKA